MKTAFHISFSLHAAGGIESFARFELGPDRKLAKAIFNKLHTVQDGPAVLVVELVETTQGLPVNLHLAGCSLDQLADNCKIITCEIFKARNLQLMHRE